MTSQRSLFDTTPTQQQINEAADVGVRARARKSDHESSHQAAQRMNESGATLDNCRLVNNIVRDNPGLTSKEISELHRCSLDRHETARRLSDCERRGWLKKVKPEGGQLRWYPAD